MSLTVWYPRPGTDGLAPALRERLGSDVAITFGEDDPPDAFEVLVCGRPTAPQLDGSRALRAVVIPWAGVAAETRALVAARPGLALYNVHHNAAPAAEMAVALLLAAARGLVPADRDLRRGDWRVRYAGPSAPLLEGRRALVLGGGAIGGRVARKLTGLGLDVTVVTRRNVAELPALLPAAQVLMGCLPETPATIGLLGAAELALLPAGAVLVNVGRASLFDEAALYAALAARHVAAAGLDVWTQYPEDEPARAHTLPSSLPFHELDNVVLSPHRAGTVHETEALRADAVARTLTALARGAEPEERVDTDAGY